MDPETLSLIQRSHEIFGTAGDAPQVRSDTSTSDALLARNIDKKVGGGQAIYNSDLDRSRSALRQAGEMDTTMRKVIAQLMAEHAQAHRKTKAVLDAARADNAPASDTPIGRREAIQRKMFYLRQQQESIRTAHSGAQRARASLRKLRYQRRGRSPVDIARMTAGLPKGRGTAAFKHALTQLGVRYVYGGNAWGKGIDCSKLTQHAWELAGVKLGRTTWEQIKQGIPVHRSQIAVGDLVFPYNPKDPGGHVQMYAGNGKVIEAPYTGANVRIVDMPKSIMAIRRPV